MPSFYNTCRNVEKKCGFFPELNVKEHHHTPTGLFSTWHDYRGS